MLMDDNIDVPLMSNVDAAVSRTLESMAFTEVIPLRKEPEASVANEVNLWSSVEILEPIKGKVVLLLSKLLADSLVSSIYGIFDEDELTSSHLNDAINEVLNTLGGQICVELFGSETLYNLGLPEFGMIKQHDEYENPGDNWIRVDYIVEGCLMSVLLETSFANFK
jgi:hypothetical protein